MEYSSQQTWDWLELESVALDYDPTPPFDLCISNWLRFHLPGQPAMQYPKLPAEYAPNPMVRSWMKFHYSWSDPDTRWKVSFGCYWKLLLNISLQLQGTGEGQRSYCLGATPRIVRVIYRGTVPWFLDGVTLLDNQQPSRLHKYQHVFNVCDWIWHSTTCWITKGSLLQKRSICPKNETGLQTLVFLQRIAHIFDNLFCIYRAVGLGLY